MFNNQFFYNKIVILLIIIIELNSSSNAIDRNSASNIYFVKNFPNILNLWLKIIGYNSFDNTFLHDWLIKCNTNYCFSNIFLY